jgi:hypothetical protein
LRVLSMLLEVPTFATIFQDVYSYIFTTVTYFGPCWPSSGGLCNSLLEAIASCNLIVHKARRITDPL